MPVLLRLQQTCPLLKNDLLRGVIVLKRLKDNIFEYVAVIGAEYHFDCFVNMRSYVRGSAVDGRYVVDVETV